MKRNLAAVTVPELSGEGTVGWEVGGNGEIVFTLRGPRQDSSISAIYPLEQPETWEIGILWISFSFVIPAHV